MTTALKHAVSKKKRRLAKDGFDLDMAYIMDNIIAMGFPAAGKEAIYRNPWQQTKKFLEKYHSGHYRLYNLCSERDYDHAKFDGNVVKFPFDDHNPPPLQLIIDCCENLAVFLNEDEENVAAIHCKAGKGRTGVIICCWMIHCGHFPEAAHSMQFYGAARTHDQQGVTIPSQRRFVRYYEDVVKYGGLPTPVTRKINKIIFSAPAGNIGPHTISTKISFRTEEEEEAGAWPPKLRFESDPSPKFKPKELKGQPVEIELGGVECRGETKVEINAKVGSKSEHLMHFWFHTGFLEDTLVMTKPELDAAKKDCKKHKRYPEDFTVTVEFEPIPDDQRPTFPKQSEESSAAASSSSSSSSKAASSAKSPKKSSRKRGKKGKSKGQKDEAESSSPQEAEPQAPAEDNSDGSESGVKSQGSEQEGDDDKPAQESSSASSTPKRKKKTPKKSRRNKEKQ